MFSHCNLAILILALTFHDQVHTGEIIGGHEVVPHSRPYMVLLEEHKSDGHIAHCDGFLINEDFVMTAAHCEAKLYKVFLGLHNTNKKKEIQSVMVNRTNAFPHKGYNSYGLKNDIMLLKLSTKAKLSKNVKTIALAGHGDGSIPKSCIVCGWGKTEEGKGSVTLLEVNVTLTGNEICAEEKKYCSEGETGPGEGDSGGPLVCDGKVYGVVSGSGKPNKDGPTLYSYTKIPAYRDWIDSIIKHN